MIPIPIEPNYLPMVLMETIQNVVNQSVHVDSVEIQLSIKAKDPGAVLSLSTTVSPKGHFWPNIVKDLQTSPSQDVLQALLEDLINIGGETVINLGPSEPTMETMGVGSSSASGN